MRVKKGQTVSVPVRFRVRGVLAQFVNPPKWTLYNSEGQTLLSGAANNEGDSWVANFTIPTSYVVLGGEERLDLQFEAHDRNNNQFVTDRELTIEDASEDFQPIGLLYNSLTKQPVRDYLVLNDTTATVTIQVFNPGGTLVLERTEPSISDNRVTSGYLHEFTLDMASVLPEKNLWLDPYQVIYVVDGEAPEIHPLYILDSKTLNVVSSLTTYLDKARLREIDPSFQWNLVELVQSVYEGIKYVNGAPPEGTYWNTSLFPPALDSYLFAAAATFAINARVVAEGLNSFEFSGLNTNLTYNRMEVLNAKLGELANILEQLPAAKRSGIMSAGKGTAPPGVTDARRQNLGVLRVTTNTLNNRFGFRGRNRFMFP